MAVEVGRQGEGEGEGAHFADDPDQMVKEFVRDVHIRRLSVSPIGGGPPLIVGADLKLTHGHRYGLIGYNGGLFVCFAEMVNCQLSIVYSWQNNTAEEIGRWECFRNSQIFASNACSPGIGRNWSHCCGNCVEM